MYSDIKDREKESPEDPSANANDVKLEKADILVCHRIFIPLGC
jgi:hypothetical protein